MKKQLLSLSIIILCICHISCKKSEPTEDATLHYQYKVKSNTSLSIGATSAGTGDVVPHGTKGSLTWAGLHFNVGKVTIAGTSSGKVLNRESSAIGLVYPFAADSLSGNVKLPAGNYQNCSFNFQLTPPPTYYLFNLRMLYYDMNNSLRETFLFIEQPISFVVNVGSFTIENGENVAHVDVEMQKLLTGLTRSDFETTTKEIGSNLVLVSTTKNKPLYDKLTMNIASAFTIRFSKP